MNNSECGPAAPRNRNEPPDPDVRELATRPPAAPRLDALLDHELAQLRDNVLADLALADKYEYNAHLREPLRRRYDAIEAERKRRASPAAPAPIDLLQEQWVRLWTQPEMDELATRTVSYDLRAIKAVGDELLERAVQAERPRAPSGRWQVEKQDERPVANMTNWPSNGPFYVVCRADAWSLCSLDEGKAHAVRDALNAYEALQGVPNEETKP